MHIILHDLQNHLRFAPLTLTRPVGNLRTGMFTNDERWRFYCPDAIISYHTEDYLAEKFPVEMSSDNFWVNAAVIPTESLVKKIRGLKFNESLFVNDSFVAYRGADFKPDENKVEASESLILLENRWDLFQKNHEILVADFQAYTKGKTSEPLSSTNTLIGDEKNLFIEQGAHVECAILNVTEGPIYIGKDAEIMEGSAVRGGLAMAENSVLKLLTKVYGATSLGPHSKVGGEVNNVIFQGYSNKGHDGFLGNSLIGEWCNLGADTNCSNLKNNYGKVRTYDYEKQEEIETNLQFMGVVMGDFSKTSINTMLNTATVIGVSATIFCAGFPPKYVPDFSWGGQSNSPTFDFDKALEAANNMMVRRGVRLTNSEEKMLRYLFQKK